MQTTSSCLVFDTGVVLGTVNATNLTIVDVSTQAKHGPTFLPSFLAGLIFLAKALITIPGHCWMYMYTPYFNRSVVCLIVL